MDLIKEEVKLRDSIGERVADYSDLIFKNELSKAKEYLKIWINDIGENPKIAGDILTTLRFYKRKKNIIDITKRFFFFFLYEVK